MHTGMPASKHLFQRVVRTTRRYFLELQMLLLFLVHCSIQVVFSADYIPQQHRA